jgi:hypothetical protein
MPAPAIPRRAAPPRRKQAPPPPPPEPESEPALAEPAAVELLASASDTLVSEVTETDTEATPAAATAVLPVEKDEAASTEEPESILEAATPPSASTSLPASPTAQAEDSSPHAYDAAIKVEPPTPYVSAFANTQTTAGKQEEAEAEAELDQQEPEEEEEEEEEEESPEEKRTRIAEKLKEMGALNRFAGEPPQPETAASESDTMDADAQKAVPTDQSNQYVHGHHDEDGSEVDYPGGSVASPTSPTRTAPVQSLSMSVPPPPFRPPVEVEKEYEGKDHYKAPGEFPEEEGNVSSAADVDGDDEFKGDVQVLLASRPWAEDGGDKGEGKHLSPSFRLTASLMACVVMNVRLEHIPSENRNIYT